MAILRPFLTPSVGIPQPVIARRRSRSMNEQQFYEPEQQQMQTEFTSPPVTGDVLREQLEKYAQRAAPPSLDPAARVKAPDQTLAQPGNFQKFYEMLSTIRRSGQEQLHAEQAKAAFARKKQLLEASSQPVGAAVMPSLETGNTPASGGYGAAGSGLGIPSNPQANFKFAQEIAPNFGWNGNELAAWYTLGMKESGWRSNAQNPTSTAYGIGQFLDSTWAGVGMRKTSDPRVQVEAMARYIRNRYGTPSKALAFHRSHNWY